LTIAIIEQRAMINSAFVAQGNLQGGRSY